MKVSTTQPFQLIYSLFEHEYLGYLFESFVVQLDEKARLTLQHQNISAKNAHEFSSGLDDTDIELIKLMDQIQQEAIILKFYKKKIKPADFFLKVYAKEGGDQQLQKTIHEFIERKREEILKRLSGKMIFEMGRDGEPAWKQIHYQDEKATVLFHFRRNEDNTHYFPTIKFKGEKLEWQYNHSYLLCHEPAYLVVGDKLIHFAKDVDGHKLKPFLNKKFIVIPRKVEETYYQRFVTQLVESFDVYAKGFDIQTQRFNLEPKLKFSELAEVTNGNLFSDEGNVTSAESHAAKILFKINWKYGPYHFDFQRQPKASVKMSKEGEQYTFHKVYRHGDEEVDLIAQLKDMGLELKEGRLTMPRGEAFSWLNNNASKLEELGVEISQSSQDQKRYFLGESSIDIEVNEGIDWFDIKAVIKFGDFEMPFDELRKILKQQRREFELPNGEIAVIPDSWIADYAELFAFVSKDEHQHRLKKHHLALVQDLKNGRLAKVSMDRKLQKLQHFEKIEDYELSPNFKGQLRPYQKAGYNWMRFLTSFNFGGCLADDMGLGKTVQTLAMLQSRKDLQDTQAPSLLIMPTSLIYNWQLEAKKFTPKLKVLIYAGTNRVKDPSLFQHYDLVITSYGITRIDKDILADFYFDYVILDESQAIKNPDSIISRAVKELNSRYRLILTGTPLENSTLDLWSQISFINPGLLGTQKFFKDEFLIPIEKKRDEEKTRKLNVMIKPFIMRRQKSQVAKDLPDKIEQIKYSDMTVAQEEQYEEVKTYYRNKILDTIEKEGIRKSQMLLLQGLTKLRQLANHPLMVDEQYAGDSGKLEDIMYMIESAISEGHKILIFSQFVKHLSIIKDFVESRDLAYAYLDGSTRDRQQQVELFQEDENVKLFLISLKAGGLGLNLTRADYVFLLDPWWNPAIEAQAVDRAHRIGQKNTVFTYKFITRNTVEEKILALQQSKLRLATDLITTEESFVKKLSSEDIGELLS
jgi:SNF2 family DNA or RNA helicase